MQTAIMMMMMMLEGTPPSEFWVPFIINMLHEAERKVDLCAEDGVL